MRRGLVFGIAALLALGGQAAAQRNDRIPPQNILTPPPARGSELEKDEIAEILKARRSATSAALAQARRDNDAPNATIFAGAIGVRWDLTKLPKTKFLADRILEVERADAQRVKQVYRRDRPWIADPKIQTCAPHAAGPAADSYPSGHAVSGFMLGVVLASLMPERAAAILARATQYGENRILCGFHFRSDVSAGQQFGTVRAMELMKQPQFQGWFKQAQAELKAASLAH